MRWPFFALGAALVGAAWAFMRPSATLPVLISLWTAYQVWSLRVALIRAWRKPGDGGWWLVAWRFLSSFLVWGMIATSAATPTYFAIVFIRRLISH
jgi:hypothetical protein